MAKKTPTKKSPKAKASAAKKSAVELKASNRAPGTTEIGGVTIKLARPPNTKKGKAIRKAVHEYYAARRS